MAFHSPSRKSNCFAPASVVSEITVLMPSFQSDPDLAEAYASRTLPFLSTAGFNALCQIHRLPVCPSQSSSLPKSCLHRRRRPVRNGRNLE
jgi:hypothetical protein